MATEKSKTTGVGKAGKSAPKTGSEKKPSANKTGKPLTQVQDRAAKSPAAKKTSGTKPEKPAAKPKDPAPKAASSSKPSSRSSAKTATKAPGSSSPSQKPSSSTKQASKQESSAVAASQPSRPVAEKPVKKQAPEPAAAPVRKEAPRDVLTPEEKERKAKLKATLALLKADPEWPAFLEEQKEALMHLRDQLLPNMQDVTRDHLRSGASNVSSSSGQHIGDAGSEAEVRDLTIRLLGKDREQLFEIDAALERIRLGYYGICEVSLEPIPKKRLQARPFCRLTVKCQEEFEKKYGSYANFKAKNNDHVGYAGLQNDMENVFSLDDGEE